MEQQARRVTVGDDFGPGEAVATAATSSALSIAFNRAMDKAIEELAQMHVARMAERLTKGMIQRANQQNHAQTVAAINRALGVDVSAFIQSSPAISTAIDAALIENVNLIRSIQAQYLDKVRLAISQNALAGRRPSAIVAELQRIGGVTESRAKLIARDQANKLNGALTQARQTSLGITQYRWSTSGDERVRQECFDLDGDPFSWDKPPPGGHPGFKINCRCVALPIFESDE